jgi:RNA polymerase sigma factor (TIGR02999 family)
LNFSYLLFLSEQLQDDEPPRRHGSQARFVADALDRLYTPAISTFKSYTAPPMTEVTRVLSAIEQGDPHAAEQLLPLVYDELRKLAAQKLAKEKPGQTLQGTALVHEAYLRLVGGESCQLFSGRGHFFAAAAEAMRRILVERARAKHRIKRGGGGRQQELREDLLAPDASLDKLLAVHDALDQLERHDAQAAALVKLRFFAGFEHQEAAEMLGLGRRAADRLWLLARTWLFRAMHDEEK